MEIIKKELNNNTYTFVCETWETSRAWGHRVTMFRNNTEYTTQKITYYNRTWESFTYQTCIYKCINQVIDEENIYILDEYKRTHDKKRLTQQQKDDILKDCKLLQELKQLKGIL